jgi:UDP-N-acetylglucosamine 1-carboxyvinyltransferase
MVKTYAGKTKGAHIYLDIASVGATINIMLAAVCAEGTTIIENAAREPHIVDTANFLNLSGAKIRGAGTESIRIQGVESLHGCEYTIIPDQIETGTYMVAAAITRGDVTVRNVIPKHMESLSSKLREMGCQVVEGENSLQVIGKSELNAVNVKTTTYPGFPTDLQPQFCALLCTAKGTGSISETVFENRFQYVNELQRLGAAIKVSGRAATVEGVPKMTGARVTAADLRAGVSLVLAGLAAEGETAISNCHLIDRGYEKIEEKLRGLGADVHRVDY